MNNKFTKKSILKDIQIYKVEESIYSVLDKKDRASNYDNKVKGYDALIGNRIYNKLIWKNNIANYHDFCLEALNKAHGDIVLDAGCGSLVFTAKAYAKSTNQQIILLDRSLGMLRRAKERLEALCGGYVPKHITLIQGDVFDLPFKANIFDTVISQGLLHMFDNKEQLLSELERVKHDNGAIFFTSLVGNSFIGRKYLALLNKAGEVAVPYNSQKLGGFLEKIPFEYKLQTVGNMAYLRG